MALQVKRCGFCKFPLRGKDAARRNFCDRECMAAAQMHAQPGNVAMHKRTQREIPTTQFPRCESCGGLKNRQRHHFDIADPHAPVAVLCIRCHVKADQNAGKWGWLGYKNSLD